MSDWYQISGMIERPTQIRFDENGVMIMTDKTDAEFIAECEAALANSGMGTYKGVPVVFDGGLKELLPEAIERLKRANERITELLKDK